MTWRQCSAERYEEMLGVLPPRDMSRHGFLVGEPSSHRRCKESGNVLPDWAAFVQVGGQYYEGPSLTMPEWRNIYVEEIVERAKLADFDAATVIIRAIHERGLSQRAALAELEGRGLWLTNDQKDQAGLDRAP